jgi:hypothetical protein
MTAKEAETLLPCPFCGGPATLEEIKLGDVSNWSVGCVEHDGEPLCMGYQSLTQFARKCEAVAAWNRRPPTMRTHGWLGPELHDKATALTVARASFDKWWVDDGSFIDPDTDDVPWFDKRKELCWCAFRDAILDLDDPTAGPEGLGVPQEDPDPSPKPTGDGLVDREVREAVARTIEPFYCKGVWDLGCAEAYWLERASDALTKADSIITLLGGRSDSSAQSQPKSALHGAHTEGET